MKKSTVISTLNEFPNEFKLDELLEKLIIIDKIELGLKEAKEGKTISHAEAKDAISQWLK
jgi:predicted transcriptional regulator